MDSTCERISLVGPGQDLVGPDHVEGLDAVVTDDGHGSHGSTKARRRYGVNDTDPTLQDIGQPAARAEDWTSVEDLLK